MSKFKAVAQVLLAAKAQVEVLLPEREDEMHRLKLAQTLQREADYILLITDSGDPHSEQAVVHGPAKTMGGKPIAKIRKITESDLLPSDDKVLNLKQDIEAAEFYFNPEASSEGILANIPDLIIRGVAKKAGLKVTKDEPKELTVEFIDAIKLALHPIELKPKELTKEEAERFMEEYTSEVQLVHSSLSAEDIEISETQTPAETTEAAVEENGPATEELAEPKAEPKEAKKQKGNK